MPFSDGKADAAPDTAGRVGEAIRFLEARSLCSLAWLDDRLCPLEWEGPLLGGLQPGVPITRSMPVFIGLDDDILALRAAPDGSVVVPNVMTDVPGGTGARVNYALFWMGEAGRYLLLVVREVSLSDLEYRLAAEVRGRAIAESLVAAQARELQRVNRQLAEANRDLQEFASVISHDLRAPLRGLRYAASDAVSALEASDEVAAGQHLRRALQQSRRMSAMLSGLLEYSRAGRKSERSGTVDTGELAVAVVDGIGADAGTTISIEGRWPSIVTLADPLDIVLRNLVDNAVKHHDCADGRVILRCEESPEALVFSVADDGPGIDPAWHEAIFLPFRQVADGDEADGAGIGLALVKKTVERFGGSIEVISDPSRGRGAEFRVVWPKHLAD